MAFACELRSHGAGDIVRVWLHSFDRLSQALQVTRLPLRLAKRPVLLQQRQQRPAYTRSAAYRKPGKNPSAEKLPTRATNSIPRLPHNRLDTKRSPPRHAAFPMPVDSNSMRLFNHSASPRNKSICHVSVLCAKLSNGETC